MWSVIGFVVFPIIGLPFLGPASLPCLAAFFAGVCLFAKAPVTADLTASTSDGANTFLSLCYGRFGDANACDDFANGKPSPQSILDHFARALAKHVRHIVTATRVSLRVLFLMQQTQP